MKKKYIVFEIYGWGYNYFDETGQCYTDYMLEEMKQPIPTFDDYNKAKAIADRFLYARVKELKR